MKVSTLFKGKYLKAASLGGAPVRVTIESLTMEELGEDKEEKPVVYFQNKDQGLVLNRTNASVLADLFGDESDGWIGKQIVLSPEKVSFQGRLVDAIRVRQPAPVAIAEDLPF